MKFIPGTINTKIDRIRRTSNNDERYRLVRKLPWSRMTAGQRQTARNLIPNRGRKRA